MTTIVTHKCDICDENAELLQQKIQVVFLTEQTEGRPTEPHLSNEVLDLCKNCMKTIIDKHPIRGCGCQGHNNYKMIS